MKPFQMEDKKKPESEKEREQIGKQGAKKKAQWKTELVLHPVFRFSFITPNVPTDWMKRFLRLLKFQRTATLWPYACKK